MGMKKALNLERLDKRRIQLNVEDIQFIEENGEDKTNIMVRHFGQITVRHPLDEVIGWIDALWGRTAVVSLQEAKALNEAEAVESGIAEPLHTDRSRKSVLGMMHGVRRLDDDDGAPSDS
jgi:hypothetical protein